MKILVLSLCFLSFQLNSQVLPKKIHSFPKEINESSGILIDGQHIWTHNDGDISDLNERGQVLFLLDTAFQIKKKVRVPMGLPYDFEDITQDQDHIYLGNMGDNNNFFPYKIIYQFKKSDLYTIDNPIPSPIYFGYSNQPDQLPPAIDLRNFDCESMIVKDTSIFLFSKNRGISPYTYVYQLSRFQYIQEAKLIDSIWTGSWVTSVAINSDQTKLAILANSKLILISDFKGNQFSKGKLQEFTIPNSQKEAITFKDNNTLWITDEKNRNEDGCIYEININQALNQAKNFTNFNISPISVGKKMYIAYNGRDLIEVSVQIFDLEKKMVYSESFKTSYGEGKAIKHKLSSGKYIIKFKTEKYIEEYWLEVDLEKEKYNNSL